MEDIVTPVDVDEFECLLIETNYNRQETEYLVKGFKNGFSLEYAGDRQIRRFAPNLPLRVGSLTELWNKVMF